MKIYILIEVMINFTWCSHGDKKVFSTLLEMFLYKLKIRLQNNIPLIFGLGFTIFVLAINPVIGLKQAV